MWLCIALTRSVSYLTDTGPNLIYGYDYAPDGNLANRKVAVDALAQGLPANTWCDGMCVDTDGGIWSARYVGENFMESRCC